MSYILDALRRADAERERDPARGIHAQPAAVLPRDAQPPREPWVLAGAAVVVAIAGAYLLAGPEPLTRPGLTSKNAAIRCWNSPDRNNCHTLIASSNVSLRLGFLPLFTVFSFQKMPLDGVPRKIPHARSSFTRPS